MVRVPRSSTPTRRTRPNPDAILFSSPSRPSKASSRPTRITIGDTRLKVTPILDELYHWVVARHEIYLSRVQGRPADEWTDDAIFRRHKFTNVFRELDRVTQYEIRHVINRHHIPTEDNEDAIREAVFRVLIFKIFNRPSTWELLNESEVGPVSWKTFNFSEYKAVLDRAHAKGAVLYNPAYQILPPMEFKDYEDCPTTWSKHLKLVALMMEEGLAEDLMASDTIEDVRFGFDNRTYAMAHSLPRRIGRFTTSIRWPISSGFSTPSRVFLLTTLLTSVLRMILDLSYIPAFHHWARVPFTTIGPGSRRGLVRIFGAKVKDVETEAVQWLVDTQFEHFKRLGIEEESIPRLSPAHPLGLTLVDMEHSLYVVWRCRSMCGANEGAGARLTSIAA